jgi:hypothetical protein
MIRETTVTRRRVVGTVLGAFIALAVTGIALAGPPPPDTMTLNLPAANAVIAQNDSSLSARGCIFDAARGWGYAIDFSWNSPPSLKGVKRYELVLQQGTAAPLVFDVPGSTTTSFIDVACNSFVIDGNLAGWHWQVSALNTGKKVIAISEQRPLEFAACRLADTSACNAPA